ncbi:hypothetical protein [Agromyces sp. C10]|uniref:hypothetical protein n=1 Tax=Agromyces sp. C10 TaxID=2935077 RepID=UPI00200A281B|nr:hypothetical protein [Agromyces sp. C10]MCK8608875.1 hypothetical protein [Agromyces sp. C10]
MNGDTESLGCAPGSLPHPGIDCEQPDQIWTLPEYMSYLVATDEQFGQEYEAELEDGNVIEWVSYLTAIAIQHLTDQNVRVWNVDSPTFVARTEAEWVELRQALIHDFEEAE